MNHIYEQLKPLADGIKHTLHTAINLRLKSGHLTTAQPGDWLTKDESGDILSVSKTKPEPPSPVVPATDPAPEPETT